MTVSCNGIMRECVSHFFHVVTILKFCDANLNTRNSVVHNFLIERFMAIQTIWTLFLS